jgi:hypothetical protein
MKGGTFVDEKGTSQQKAGAIIDDDSVMINKNIYILSSI